MNLEEQKQILKEKMKEIENRIEAKKNIIKEGTVKFYHFRQSNSGGSFIDNDDVCIHVFIEAHNAEEANSKADEIGIYFDGVSLGSDCSCCGDRWYPTSDGSYDSNLKPQIDKGVDIHDTYSDSFSDKCIIYYLDGKKERVVFKTWKDCPGHIWERPFNIGNKCRICKNWEEELKKKMVK